MRADATEARAGASMSAAPHPQPQTYPPMAQGRITPMARKELVQAWQSDSKAFWRAQANDALTWQRPFTRVLDESQAPYYRWFDDGMLNASQQCLDRHLPERANEVALTWESEAGEVRNFTFGELHDLVCRFAGTLQSNGVAAGDRVILYLPLVPEAVIAMLACARIGAVHSVVFGGFSAKALADRINDTGAKVVLTADGAYRNTKVVPLKANVDAALANCPDVERVLVHKRTGETVAMQPGRDVAWTYGTPVLQPPAFPAEHPLFILYTSGSTGKPKGILHTTGGYLLWAQLSSQWVFDLTPEDTYWCTADIGWITGHTYVAYGPLMVGARLVLYEGAPMCPAPDRFWSIIEKHKVNVFYTAPTAIRALMAAGDKWPAKHDLSSLRLLGSVGEPINPEAWKWYHTHIGKGNLPIVDTWWQTETGGIMMSALPAADHQKPGSCNQPLPGISASILAAEGDAGADSDEGGQLILDTPWPSMLRGIWGDDEKFRETYWSLGAPRYLAGDTARRDADGDYWIMGRSDDVLNVSGHRIGTMEVESALASHPDVVEAAVVGVPDEVRGESVFAFVVCTKEVAPAALAGHVAEEIGKTARPRFIVLAAALPKTRSGKIMRRLLRAIARGEPMRQDTSTLEDAHVVEALQAAVPTDLDSKHAMPTRT